MSMIHIRVPRLLRTAVLATSVGALAVAVSVPAQAIDSTKVNASPVSINRVMDLSHETLPESKLARAADETVTQSPDKVVETQGVTPLPAGVTLSPGEALQVNYADGVVVHEAITAACTITRVSNTPIKYTASTPDRATATHRVSLTSGCAGGTVYGNLLIGTAPNGASVAQKSVQGKPNVTTSWATYRNCQTTLSTNYFSQTAGLGGLKTSSTARLTCY